MPRKLVTIQKIEEILPIEGADRIEKIRIKEWWVVSQKGLYKEDDLVLFYEIDSFLKILPEYEFLLIGSSLSNNIARMQRRCRYRSSQTR